MLPLLKRGIGKVEGGIKQEESGAVDRHSSSVSLDGTMGLGGNVWKLVQYICVFRRSDYSLVSAVQIDKRCGVIDSEI